MVNVEGDDLEIEAKTDPDPYDLLRTFHLLGVGGRWGCTIKVIVSFEKLLTFFWTRSHHLYIGQDWHVRRRGCKGLFMLIILPFFVLRACQDWISSHQYPRASKAKYYTWDRQWLPAGEGTPRLQPHTGQLGGNPVDS